MKLLKDVAAAVDGNVKWVIDAMPADDKYKHDNAHLHGLAIHMNFALLEDTHVYDKEGNPIDQPLDVTIAHELGHILGYADPSENNNDPSGNDVTSVIENPYRADSVYP